MLIKEAFIFPGTGSQYSGMFKGFYELFPAVRKVFEEAGDILKLNLLQLCQDGLSGDTALAVVQASIFVCSVAAHRVFEQEVGLKPSYMAGHSLGEFSALTCAGAFRFQDAVQAVWHRGQAMEAAAPDEGGLIAAIKHLSADIVKEYCTALSSKDQTVEIACYNSADQVVIAGHRRAVQKAAELLEAHGAEVVYIQAKVPFHTSLMYPAADKLREVLQGMEIQEQKCPVISNVTGLPHEQGKATIIDKLVQQMTQPVRWEQTIRYMQQSGVSRVIELGPHTVLKKLNLRIARNIKVYAWDHPEDFMAIQNLRKSKTAFLDKCLSIAVCTQNYNMNEEDYQREVVVAYKKLRQIQQECEKIAQPPSREQAREAFEQLHHILIHKKVDKDQRTALLSELFSDTDTEVSQVLQLQQVIEHKTMVL